MVRIRGGLRQMRPNQLLAWSLPYAPLAPDPRALQAIGAALLTPIGLRSLDPPDPDFRGQHRGGPADRDRAYHQGTVWPWLIGPYVDACRRSQLASATYESVFVGLVRHLAEFGLGSVSETADAIGAARRHRLPVPGVVGGGNAPGRHGTARPPAG